MKGILQTLAALLLLNAAALMLWSRAAPPTDPAKSTRVGVLNLTYVVKNYEKFKEYQNELKKKVDPYQQIDTDKKKRGEEINQELKEENLAEEDRKRLNKELVKLQREIEDNKAEAQAVLVKEQEKQLVSLYRDIQTVARRVAKQRGFDLVMHYNDVLTEAEMKAPANVARKMQAGAFLPIHMEPGIDLSEAILEELHKDMNRERS